MKYENKIVKKQKTTTKWITCLDNVRISRVLQLLEMFPDGLLQRDIFSLLDAPRDKGIMQALKELEYHGFIKREIKFGRTVEAINTEHKVKGKRLIKDIKFGLETKRERYFVTGNPIQKLFERIVELAENDTQKKYFEMLKNDISTRWKMIMFSYSFRNKYTLPSTEDTNKQIIENIEKAAELYEGKELEKARKDRDKIISDFKQLREDESEYKREKQMHQINGYRLKVETHVDYVSLQLQRILIEFFITLYTNFHKLIKSEIPQELINTIELLLFEIDPKLKKVAMIDEVTGRIQNFNNLIEITKMNKKLKRSLLKKEKTGGKKTTNSI